MCRHSFSDEADEALSAPRAQPHAGGGAPSTAGTTQSAAPVVVEAADTPCPSLLLISEKIQNKEGLKMRTVTFVSMTKGSETSKLWHCIPSSPSQVLKKSITCCAVVTRAE